MGNEERYVFDTNVLVSALLFSDSTPGQAFHHAINSGQILLSEAVIHELVDVLNREKFDRYLHTEEREQFLQALIAESALIEITERIQLCRDPKDDRFLELATCGEATALISGDADLLTLSPYRGIPILSPGEFLRTFAASQE